MTPEERKRRAQIANAERQAQYPDQVKITQAARDTAEARYYVQAKQMHPDATEAQIAKVAAALRKAFYLRLAQKSAQARKARARADQLDQEIADGLAGEVA